MLPKKPRLVLEVMRKSCDFRTVNEADFAFQTCTWGLEEVWESEGNYEAVKELAVRRSSGHSRPYIVTMFVIAPMRTDLSRKRLAGNSAMRV